MQQPEHLRSFQTENSTPRRVIALAGTFAVQFALIYALASGLASHLVDKLPSELKAEVVKETIPVKPPPPPPPPDLVKPPPLTVPPPEFQVSTPAPTTAISMPRNEPLATKPSTGGVTAPALVSGGAKCLTSYYPPIAIRLNQEGVTSVAVHVSADGSVTGVDVVSSSGHDSLDQAAVKCISNAWRFKPAMENGSPVAQTKNFAIKWQLQGG